MIKFHFNSLKRLGFIRWLSAGLICVTKRKKPVVFKKMTGFLDRD